MIFTSTPRIAATVSATTRWRVGDEVRRGDFDRATGAGDGGEEEAVDRLVVGVGTAADDGDRRAAAVNEIERNVRGGVDPLTRHVDPILEKETLEIADGRPFDSKVEIAPGADSAQRSAVFVGDVEAARERHLAVDDDDLAMVAEVDRLKEDGPHREEARVLSAGGAERVPPSSREAEATEGVAEETHFDATLRGGDEALAEPAPRLVVADHVVLGVDVVLCRVDGGADSVEAGVADAVRDDEVPGARRDLRELRAEARQGEFEIVRDVDAPLPRFREADGSRDARANRSVGDALSSSRGVARGRARRGGRARRRRRGGRAA